MIQDILTPNLKSASFGDALSDKFLGTNKVNQVQTMNNYELQKAVNLNKYGWNVEGMKAAGINPLANSGGLNGVASSQASDEQNGNGYFVRSILELADALNPLKQLKEAKEFVKNLIK